jgi:hypothetical protein
MKKTRKTGISKTRATGYAHNADAQNSTRRH